MIDKLVELPFTIVPKSETYEYNGVFVPRVSDILSGMLHEEYLLKWANGIGFKRMSYTKAVNEAADIGTQVHCKVEELIKTGKVDFDKSTHQSVINAVHSFIHWYNKVSEHNIVKTISLEERLVCQWFGGTLDWLVEVNGKTYLVDFKTSNHISYRYFLQMAAYRYMLKLNSRFIDGVIILQLSKKDENFNEYLLNFEDPGHLSYIEHCEQTFLSLVYSYYMRLHTEYLFKQIM